MSMIFQKRGFTLIEVLAVIFVVTVGVTGVYSLLRTTITSSGLISRQLTAAYLAQEGVEIVRNVRDTNWLELRRGDSISWDEGFGGEGDYKVSYENLGSEDLNIGACSGACPRLRIDNGHYGYTGEETPFRRTVHLKTEAEKIEVTITVEFNYQGQNYSVQVQENLWEWYKPGGSS